MWRKEEKEEEDQLQNVCVSIYMYTSPFHVMAITAKKNAAAAADSIYTSDVRRGGVTSSRAGRRLNTLILPPINTFCFYILLSYLLLHLTSISFLQPFLL